MMNKNLALMVLVIFAAGCGLETRTYVMTKDRVGLDQTNGNGGCVVGKCPPAPAPKETTRKVYVLEITKPVPESEVRKIEQNALNAIVETSPAPSVSTVPIAQPEVVAPVTAAQNGGNMQAQTYTVQKDDTLQKISKKVFGSYGKWYKIYKANKNKIKNPNVLKPGTVLTIPSIK